MLLSEVGIPSRLRGPADVQLLARDPQRRRRSATGMVAGRRVAVRAHSAKHASFTEARHDAEPEATTPLDINSAFKSTLEGPWRASVARSRKSRREEETRRSVEAVEGQETTFA